MLDILVSLELGDAISGDFDKTRKTREGEGGSFCKAAYQVQEMGDNQTYLKVEAVNYNAIRNNRYTIF